MALDWSAHLEREQERYEDGLARLSRVHGAEERQRQLTRMGNAAAGAGLALAMAGRSEDAAGWFTRAAERYRESFPDAPAGSWGRPIGAVKARVLAGDWEGAASDARWALDEAAAQAESPIGRYAACLALLVLEEEETATELAASLQRREDFPSPVADALAALAQRDDSAYRLAVTGVLSSFEQREEYLENVPVAETVMVLQALAGRRGVRAELRSPLLPHGGSREE